MTLPSFLHASDDEKKTSEAYLRSFLLHEAPLNRTYTLWWPTKQSYDPPKTVLLFIPGNPGLVDLYIPFLSALHTKDTSGKLAILAHSHNGHVPTSFLHDSPRKNRALAYNLRAQVLNAVEAFDAVRSEFGSACKIILAGHSAGSWIALQILKERTSDVAGVFLLCPTVSHIVSTPNGRKLSWLFRPPLPFMISGLSTLCLLLPISVVALFFREWPRAQLIILHNFLRNPSAVYAALTMAHDEMIYITDLDATLLNTYKHILWFYFAQQDDWVGDQRDLILRTFDADPAPIKIMHGTHGIPHSFCINHGEQLADQCYEWLQEGATL